MQCSLSIRRSLAWAIFILLATGHAAALADDNRTLQILRNKGVITQEEYEQILKEEKQEKDEKEAKDKQDEQEQHERFVKKDERVGRFTTRNRLQVTMGGFAEIDFTGDNTRSFTEIIGNKPVLRNGTLGGNNSQFETSPRNSRITFDVQAPEQNGLKSRYFASIDFLGNQPQIGNDGVTEFSNYTSPTPRIFQMFFLVSSQFADFKVGQDWSAFGFMSQYSRSQVSVAATPANMFNRWIQASVSKRLNVTDRLSLTPVFSIERPPQRDANLPSFVAGVQISHSGLQAPYAGSSSTDVILKPMSVQVSGVGRRFQANAGGGTNVSNQTYVAGWGVSGSMFIPVLPARGKALGNTAHVVMEGVTGAGIADFFNGLSWGVCNPVCGNSATNSGFGGPAFGQTNIDAGLAAVSAQSGKFEAIRTTSLMVHATYYLPDDGKTWVGGGYGTIYSSNANQMTCTTNTAFCGGAVRPLSSLYTRESTYYAYAFHDFTQEVRTALEVNWTRTTYGDDAHAEDRRIQMTFFYRF